MKTKKLLAVLAVAALTALVLPTFAMANFAIHGNFVENTDACAGCHRAHTSVSTLTWTNGDGDEQSALLVGAATTMQEFCYACHDATSQGADTNVQWGIYEADLGLETDSTVGDTLNGGGFEFVGGDLDNPVTSIHDSVGGTWGAYGGGLWGLGAPRTSADVTAATGETSDTNDLGRGDGIAMDCATCHDPHGTSNYRLLKAGVYGYTVGGYVGGGEDPDPNAFVQSVEVGWPDGGFRLGQPYPLYRPNYTEARYSKGYDVVGGVSQAEDTKRGMTGWCSGCHTVYDAGSSVYNSGDMLGLVTRHRHPVNSELQDYIAPEGGTGTMIVTGQELPLAHDKDEKSASAPSATPASELTDWIECLSCHRAHGTAAKMTGFAGNEIVDADLTDDLPSWVSPGINNENPSALLRSDNRGVCQSCHNK